MTDFQKRVYRCIELAWNQTLDKRTCAMILAGNKRTYGHMMLAVHHAAKALERQGRIIIWMPSGADRWTSQHYSVKRSTQ